MNRPPALSIGALGSSVTFFIFISTTTWLLRKQMDPFRYVTRLAERGVGV